MSKINTYDVIIIGAGLSGLSLAEEISRRTDHRILILEKKRKFQNDKNWCFWNLPENKFTKYADHSWKKIIIKFNSKKIELSDKKVSYLHIYPQTFYKKILKVLKNRKIEILLNQDVKQIKINKEGSVVNSNKKKYVAKLVFDSRPSIFQKNKNKLYQHFLGFEVLFKKKVFNFKEITLMDFQSFHKGVHFFYILPFSSKRALIETTYFSTNIRKVEEYRKEIKKYINHNFPKLQYKILNEEKGIIPMYHQKIYKESGYLKIGTSGNWVRSSTGFSFQDSFKNSKIITNNLIKTNEVLPLRENFHSFLDDVFCYYIKTFPTSSKDFFFSFFSKNKLKDIVYFLTGELSFLRTLLIIKSLPKLKLIASLVSILKIKLLNK